MKSGLVLAREMQDLSVTVESVAEAIREGATTPRTVEIKQEPPIVNVQAPTIEVPVVVQVPEQPAPQVTVVAEARPPVVNVERAEPAAYTVRITERDANGFISEFVIMPMNLGGTAP